MDYSEATIAGTAALVGVFIGAFIQEFFASRREERQETMRRDRERADRVRDDRLESIDQTKRAIAATLDQLAAVAAGTTPTSPAGMQVYPRFDLLLVGDIKALEAFAIVALELTTRVPGSGVFPADVQNIATTQFRVSKALEEQRRRAMVDEPLLVVTEEELAANPAIMKAIAALAP